MGGRVMILLTGASGGIGRAMQRHLTEIDEVVGIYNQTQPESAPNSNLSFEKVNIESRAHIQNFVKKWGEKLSRLTLIHSAASSIDGLAAQYAEADWDRVVGVNLKGNFLLTQALLPYMIKERWGRIIHISSVVGIQGRPGTVAYSASKSGLIGMSGVFAKEYGRFNITSNLLVLGYFEVGLIETLSADVKQKTLQQIPSKMLGKVSNISNAIDFLIKSEYVNGAVINIDGGI
jgi:3-oxoacyl-[acyl-carrier protein] reductase